MFVNYTTDGNGPFVPIITVDNQSFAYSESFSSEEEAAAIAIEMLEWIQRATAKILSDNHFTS